MAVRDNSEQDKPVTNTQVPRATLQALNQLTRQIESLNDYLVAQRAPSATQGRIQSELQAVASRQRNAQTAPTLPPSLEGGPISAGGVVLPGGVSPAASMPAAPPPPPQPYLAEPTEVTFRNRLKAHSV
jgi:hypothetical protein